MQNVISLLYIFPFPRVCICMQIVDWNLNKRHTCKVIVENTTVFRENLEDNVLMNSYKCLCAKVWVTTVYYTEAIQMTLSIKYSICFPLHWFLISLYPANSVLEEESSPPRKVLRMSSGNHRTRILLVKL